MTGANSAIVRNAAECLDCGQVVESKSRHDFVTCKCGNLSVDGGHDYLRRAYKTDGQWRDVSEYREFPVAV